MMLLSCSLDFPIISFLKGILSRDFPGGPVVKTLPYKTGGVGLIHGQGAKTPHATWPKNQNIKQEQYCNKLNKDF